MSTGAIADLGNSRKEILTGNDNIVIKKYFDGYDGGRTLNMDGYPLDTIQAGHVVIRDTVRKEFKPMPLKATKDAYDALPQDHEYVGIVVATQPANRPFVGILTNGTVNHMATPFPMDDILDDVKKACPQIEFRED